MNEPAAKPAKSLRRSILGRRKSDYIIPLVLLIIAYLVFLWATDLLRRQQNAEDQLAALNQQVEIMNRWMKNAEKKQPPVTGLKPSMTSSNGMRPTAMPSQAAKAVPGSSPLVIPGAPPNRRTKG